MIPDLPISSSPGSSWLQWFDTNPEEAEPVSGGEDVLSFFDRPNNTPDDDIQPHPTPSSTAALFSPRNKGQTTTAKAAPKKKKPASTKQPSPKRTLDAWQKQLVTLVTSPAIHVDKLGCPLKKKQMLLWGRQQQQQHIQRKKKLPSNSLLIVLSEHKAIHYEDFHTNSSMGQFLIDSRADYVKLEHKSVNVEDRDGSFAHLETIMRFELLRLLGIDLAGVPSHTTIRTAA